jgi:hypothetical protein
MRTIM